MEKIYFLRHGEISSLNHILALNEGWKVKSIVHGEGGFVIVLEKEFKK